MDSASSAVEAASSNQILVRQTFTAVKVFCTRIIFMLGFRVSVNLWVGVCVRVCGYLYRGGLVGKSFLSFRGNHVLLC